MQQQNLKRVLRSHCKSVSSVKLNVTTYSQQQQQQQQQLAQLTFYLSSVSLCSVTFLHYKLQLLDSFDSVALLQICAMGSLMPGWDSLPNSTKMTKRSKSSLTTDEIEAYWRYKQQEMETLSKERNALQNANTLPSISETKLTTTTAVTPDGTTTQEVVIEWPQPTASSPDWWTRSNWAFLNAPPETLDYPGEAHRRPYVPELGHYNRSVSSAF